MATPEDHRVLDGIFALLRRIPSFREVCRESECVEMFDPDNQQWYEIVVRPIDEPSSGLDEGQPPGGAK